MTADSIAASYLAQLEQAFLAVDLSAAREAIRAATRTFGPGRAIEAVLVPALDRLGDRWVAGSASLSQLFMAGRYAEALTDELLPKAAAPSHDLRVGVAVLEDQHLLGKRMVVAHLRAAGLAPIDLGDGVSAAVLAERVVAADLDVLLVSTLMLRAALGVKELIASLRQKGSSARVVVGGAPFRLDPTLWKTAGADACGLVASDAPRLVLELGKAR